MRSANFHQKIVLRLRAGCQWAPSRRELNRGKDSTGSKQVAQLLPAANVGWLTSYRTLHRPAAPAGPRMEDPQFPAPQFCPFSARALSRRVVSSRLAPGPEAAAARVATLRRVKSIPNPQHPNQSTGAARETTIRTSSPRPSSSARDSPRCCPGSSYSTRRART